MPSWLTYEPQIRLGIFAGMFLLLATLEAWQPRRRLTVRKSPRWLSNLALVALNMVVVRVVVPLSMVGVGACVEARQFGALQQVPGPQWLRVLLAVALLDLAIYGQHVLFHRVPVLWRVHRVHHADLDLDVTSGLRFHPVEMLLSLAIKVAAIFASGAPALGVLIFEVLLNAGSMFSHANWRLPLGCDRVLRMLLVTPDMHRVHHSVVPTETNRNFGFNLSCWDRLFRTYQAQPAGGHEGMTIGLEEYRDEQQTERWPGMLLLPWQAPISHNKHLKTDHESPLG